MTPDPRNASLPETAGNRESWVYVCTRQSSERHTGFPWPPHKPSWEPVKRQWETDGNTPWESFSSPSIAFPGGPGWLELSESLLTPFSPRLSGKGWVGKLMQWPAAGVRGHDDDTHCCKTWTLLTLAFCRLVCVSCPDWGDSSRRLQFFSGCRFCYSVLSSSWELRGAVPRPCQALLGLGKRARQDVVYVADLLLSSRHPPCTR